MIIRLLLAIALVCLTACQSLGVPPADTFNKKLAAGYATVQTVADSARTLLVTGKITPAEAQRVQTSNSQALEALDAAAAMHASDPPMADARLSMTITVLTGLQAFLATHGATK